MANSWREVRPLSPGPSHHGRKFFAEPRLQVAERLIYSSAHFIVTVSKRAVQRFERRDMPQVRQSQRGSGACNWIALLQHADQDLPRIRSGGHAFALLSSPRDQP